MGADSHHGATSTTEAWVNRLGRRRLTVAGVIGVLGALFTGSLLVAIGPIVVLVVVQLLRFQTVEKLLVFTVGATLLLAHPSENPYMGRWGSPLAPLSDLWFHPLARSVPGVPVSLAPAFLMTAWALIRVLGSRQARPAPPARLYLRACTLAAGTLLLAVLYGLARGGSNHQHPLE